MTGEKLIQAQQMQRYLEALGIATEIDFATEHLYVTFVEVKFPALLDQSLNAARTRAG